MKHPILAVPAVILLAIIAAGYWAILRSPPNLVLNCSPAFHSDPKVLVIDRWYDRTARLLVSDNERFNTHYLGERVLYTSNLYGDYYEYQMTDLFGHEPPPMLLKASRKCYLDSEHMGLGDYFRPSCTNGTLAYTAETITEFKGNYPVEIEVNSKDPTANFYPFAKGQYYCQRAKSAEIEAAESHAIK